MVCGCSLRNRECCKTAGGEAVEWWFPKVLGQNPSTLDEKGSLQLRVRSQEKQIVRFG
jgi:hypothetical protein